MYLLSFLERNQKEAIGLLQIGTFLEYFDLMLYVHMAVLLNEIFFPKTDPHTSALLTAFAFCSTFVLRPFGALAFGYIGDRIGRKTSIIAATMMMAASCLLMANLPTYAQIGITAAWLVTFCRIIQGLSSLGEIIGAEIYLTEITKPPTQYVAVGLVASFSVLGSVMALGVASFVTTSNFNWRIVFWFGAVIALVGSFARKRLPETLDFIRMKNHREKILKGIQKKDPVSKNVVLAYFLIECGFPACFYLIYIYCGAVLKNKFGYAPYQVIHQNFLVSIVSLASSLFFSLASYKINPLKLLKIKVIVFFPMMIVFPFFLSSSLSSPMTVLLFQALLVFFPLSNVSACPIFFTYFPVLKRFTWVSFTYALSQALIYVMTSFAMVYLAEIWGHWGVLFVMGPLSIGCLWSVSYFEKLEKARNVSETWMNKCLQATQA